MAMEKAVLLKVQEQCLAALPDRMCLSKFAEAGKTVAAKVVMFAVKGHSQKQARKSRVKTLNHQWSLGQLTYSTEDGRSRVVAAGALVDKQLLANTQCAGPRRKPLQSMDWPPRSPP
eukprot:875233-Amphidinium_carterae.2